MQNEKIKIITKRYINFDFCTLIFDFKRGLSLIEAILYIAFLAVIVVGIANILIQISNTYARARAEREVISNGRLLLASISGHVSSASEVYAPTSRFNSDAGSLTLVTVDSPQPEHATKYLDIWVDSGLLLMREEGKSNAIISSASVRIDRFRVERIFQGLGKEAVRITLGASFANAKFPASVTLYSTTALRGNY